MRRSKLVAVLALAGGCTQSSVNTVPPTDTKMFSLKVPVLRAVDPAKENQEKDGIRMLVTPIPFQVSRTSTKAYKAVQFLLALGPNRTVSQLETTQPEIFPNELRFKVRINNRLGRVIRLAGTVVSFQVSGKSVNVPQTKYQEFLNGIILPQQESELELFGPTLLELVGPDLNRLPGDTATVALLLFDIVTATDPAGNPTRRSNFEYYYRFGMPVRPDSVTSTVSRLTLPLATWSLIWQRQGGDQDKWARVPELDCFPNCGN